MLTINKLKIFYIAALLALFILGCGSDDEPAPAAIASFTTSSQNIKSGESVTFTSTSENETELSWIFEGGTPSTSTSAKPVVKYNSAGNFSVTLIASNGSSSDTETKSSHIKVTDPAPVASFSASSQAIKPGESVSFSNNSSNAVRFEWTFEGGDPSTSLSENPTVTYNNQGEFAVTLKAFNASNVAITESRDNFIVVDDPNPVASFSSSTSTIKTGASVSFTNTSSNATRYEWTFTGGSPSTSNSVSPSVTYNTPGTYNVTLKAFNDSDESDVETKTGLVKVLVAPTANFTESSLTVKALESITFSNTSSGSNNSYEWTFQGGSPGSSTQANPGSIKFDTEGTYTVTLKATNEVGTSTKTKTVTVIPPTEFTLKMENHLFRDVYIYNNGTYLGSITARNNKTFTNVSIANENKIDFYFYADVVGGKKVGIDFSGYWLLNSPRGEVGLEVTNKVGTIVLQYITVDNREANGVYWDVNPSTGQFYSFGNLSVGAGNFTHLGYYYFVDITEQVRLFNSSTRNSWWYITYGPEVIDDKSGRVDILFDLNGGWNGTWNGSVSRPAPIQIELTKKFKADWDMPMNNADFSNSLMITTAPKINQ